jgi:hypothetical protein
VSECAKLNIFSARIGASCTQGKPEMASPKRAELVTEITHLRKQQLESFADGIFSGWPPEQEAAHDERADRLSRLVLELEALDAARS